MFDLIERDKSDEKQSKTSKLERSKSKLIMVAHGVNDILDEIKDKFDDKTNKHDYGKMPYFNLYFIRIEIFFGKKM